MLRAARTSLAITVACFTCAQGAARAQTYEDGMHLAHVAPRLVEPSQAFTRSVLAPRLVDSLLLDVPYDQYAPRGEDLLLGLSDLRPGAPLQLAPPTINLLSDLYRVRPVNGWTFVSLGLGTAGVGLAAAFFQAAGLGNQFLLPRLGGNSSPAMDDPLFMVGNYSVRYDNLGSLSMQAGLGAISSSLFRLIYSPRENSPLVYMRTYVTELQGGWLLGFQGAL